MGRARACGHGARRRSRFRRRARRRAAGRRARGHQRVPRRNTRRRHRVRAPRQRGHEVVVHRPAARRRADVRRVARGGAAGHVALFRARVRRSVHPVRGRIGPAQEAGRSGDAALLLALRGVFRGVHLLLQRPARSSRLGVLLERRDGGGAPAAAAAAFHAGLPAASRGCRGGCRSADGESGERPRAAHVSAGAVPGGGTHRRGGARSARRVALRARDRPARSRRGGVSLRLHGRRHPGRRAGVQADHVDDRTASAAMDRVGHRAGRRAVRLRLRAAVGLRGRRAVRAPADGDSRSASCRWPSRRPSCATGCATSR